MAADGGLGGVGGKPTASMRNWVHQGWKVPSRAGMLSGEGAVGGEGAGEVEAEEVAVAEVEGEAVVGVEVAGAGGGGVGGG